MEVSSRAPPGITAVVPSCCFVFFLYPFSTSTPPLKLAVKKKKKPRNPQLIKLSVWVRWPRHFSVFQFKFGIFYFFFHQSGNPSPVQICFSDKTTTSFKPFYCPDQRCTVVCLSAVTLPPVCIFSFSFVVTKKYQTDVNRKKMRVCAFLTFCCIS